jgi:membrane protein required for colicin V production
MTLLDVLVLGILFALVVLGAIRGVVKDIVLLIGIIAGAYFAWHYGPQVRQWLQPMIHSRGWVWFLGYALTFLSVVTLSALVGTLVSRLIHNTPLGWFDRLLGAGLGLVKGAILIWGLVSVALLVRPEAAATIEISPVTRGIVRAGNGIIGTYRPRAEPKGRPTKPAKPRRRGEYVLAPEHHTDPSGT